MNKQEIGKAIEILSSFDGTTDQGLQRAVEMAVPLLQRELKALTQQLNNGWIPVSERLPQLPDGKSFMPLNATILAPSGLRSTVQMTWELKRGKPTWCYLGGTPDWNVIAWQPLPEPYKEENYD